MNLSQLYYFRKLAELQNFTQAATELYITQPTLSASISALEKELGTKLFQKAGRNVELTKYGQLFYSYVFQSLQTLDEGIQELHSKVGLLKGNIDIICIPTLLGTYLPSVLNAYNSLQPNMDFSIHDGKTQDIIEAIKSGEFDIGFCSYIENEPDLSFVPVLNQPIIAIINTSHELAKSKVTKLCLDELKPYILSTYRKELAIGKLCSKLLSGRGLDINYCFNDEISLGGFTSINSIVGIVADTPLLDQFEHLIKLKLIDVPEDSRQVCMVYSNKNYLSKPVTHFIEYIKNEAISLKDEKGSDTPYTVRTC